MTTIWITKIKAIKEHFKKDLGLASAIQPYDQEGKPASDNVLLRQIATKLSKNAE